MATVRTTKRLAATTSYQSINTNGERVYGIINNSGQTVIIRFNSGAGEVTLADGVFWEFSSNIGNVTSLVEIKLALGTGNVDYIG